MPERPAHGLGEDDARICPASVKELPQERFQPFDFETSTMNLHKRANSRIKVDVAVVFVHGFMGSGYSTWGRFPEILFHAEIPICDVAVFDYFSGHRRRVGKRPSLEEVAKALAEELADLERRYVHIYFIAHSMGGLIAQNAIRWYLDNHDRSTRELKALAAVVLFGCPLEGSRLSSRIFSPVFPEAAFLRANAPHQRQLRQYITNNIEARNLEKFGDHDYQIPMFSGYGQFDFWVSRDSATSGVVDGQCRSFRAGHKKLVKPNSTDSEQVGFVHQIIEDVTDKREQMRFGISAGKLRRNSILPGQPLQSEDVGMLVTELLRELDGHEWWSIYKAVIAEASTESVRVLDRLELGEQPISTNLLMCVSDSKNVVSRRSATVQLLEKARDAYRDGQMDVRIVAVGDGVSAVDALFEIVEHEKLAKKPNGFFVDVARDSGEVRYLLHRYVAVLVADIEERLRKDEEQSESLQMRG
jgi:pimeloyl-ACP methyl ester carboxylesterase